MLLDIGNIKRDDVFDYCVIGTGPAGITQALQLSSTGRKVALLEGGSEQFTDTSQNLYKGNVIGDEYWALDASRLRYFGGTSNHWGGWCRTLDHEDYLAKGKLNITEWPIRKSDLDPYLKRALLIAGVKETPEDEILETNSLKKIGISYSKPTVRFAEKYGETIAKSENIFLVLNANVTSFETNGTSVISVNITDHEGKDHVVKAGTYILATGAIESSRILLWSNELTNGQLIKDNGTLGKYWMEHPHFQIGEAIIAGRQPFSIDERGRTFFAPTLKTMIENRILNCRIHFEPVTYYQETKKIIADLACVAPKIGMWAANLLDKNLICGAKLKAVWEQEPRESNRIELSDQLDSLGIPRINLYWEKSEMDLRTVRVTAETFGKYLIMKDIGRVRLDDWVFGDSDYPTDGRLAGPHHMGGTRMASDPKKGIVDKNCKVFGQSNLYIAGSSVFPSGGHANPTLTIIQLSLRLADHLIRNT